MAKASQNTQVDTGLESKRKELISNILELREAERKLLVGQVAIINKIKVSEKDVQKSLNEKTKQLKKIVELVNAENTAVKEQITNYADAERSIANLNDIQHDLKDTLKDAVGYGTDFAQSIGQASAKNKEAFKNAGIAASSAITSVAELADLTNKDKAAIAEKNQVINNSLADLKAQLALTEAKGKIQSNIDKSLISNLLKQIELIKESQEEAGKFANLSKETKELYHELHEGIETINKAFKKVTTGIEVFASSGKNMVGMLLFGAAELSHHFVHLNKELGVGMTQLIGLKTQATLIGTVLGEEAGAAVIDLAKDLGDSHHLTTSMAVDAGLLAANYGMSAKEAAFMSVAFGELQGKSYGIGKNTGEYVKQLALANYVAPAQVMKDIAANTEFFAVYSKDGGKNIADAAVAAAKLGVGLETAEKMADHLLDYQSSVEDEMEASVLLGKEINLNKARELAYNGDIAGSLKAGLEAVGGIHAYSKMDPYQRKATAKALGVSNAELQQMVAHEETLNGMHGVGNQMYSKGSEMLTAMGNSLTGKILTGMSALVMGAGHLNLGLTAMGTSLMGLLTPLKALGSFVWYLAMAPFRLISGTMGLIFQKIGASAFMTKLWGGFTGGVSKMLGWVRIAMILINERIKSSTMLTTIWGAITRGVGAAFGGIMKAGTWMLNTMFPGLIAKMGALKGVSSIFGGATAAADVAGGAGGAAKGGKAAKGMRNTAKAAKVAKGAKVAGNVAQGSSLIPMAAGLTAMGTGAVALGAANLIIAGIGFTAMIPGAIGMFLISKINLVALGAGLTQLAVGLTAMSGTLAGSAALIAAGIGFTAMIPATIGMFLMSKINLIALGTGLATLATGLTAMSGTFMGSLAVGAAALAFTLMIPGALGMAAFGLTAPIAAAGLGIMGTALIAFGATAPVAGIGILMLLGLAGAFAIFGYGVSLIGEGIKSVMQGIGSMVAILPQLAVNMGNLTSMILPIFGLAAAISVLALSLIALSAASVLALPAIAMMGFAAGAGNAVFGGGNKDEEMVALLKSIDSKIGGQPAINIDGKKLIQEQNVNSSRQGTGNK